MRRRTALLVGAAVLAAARLVPASGDTPAPTPELPHDVCSHAISDPAGDARPMSGPADVPLVTANNAGLDIQAVDVRLTDTQLQVFLGINHFDTPPQMTGYEEAWRYYVKFKIDGQLFTFGGQLSNASATSVAKPIDSNNYEAPNGYIFEKNSGDLAGATLKFVPGTAPALSWVVYTAPRKTAEKVLGLPLMPTDVATGVSATTEDWSTRGPLPGGDSLPTLTPAQDQLVIGDDWCFGPPPTAISNLTAPAVTYGHSTTLSAVLKDENAKALAGKTVTFAVQDGKGTTLTGTTDASGLATATYGPDVAPAGSYRVVAHFAGEGTTLKASSATGTLVVSAQPTTFTAPKVAKVNATTRSVTVSLLDDLQNPVAGVNVDWYVNGKKTATTTTDKTGKTVFRTAKPGQKIQAKFAGKPGYWLAAASAITKVT